MSESTEGGMVCPHGTIYKKRHVRTRKHHKVVVSHTCAKRPRSTVRIGSLKKGELSSVGYHSVSATPVRRRSLKKAVHKYGALSTLRKLNALSVLNKHHHPGRAQTFRRDRNWISRIFINPLK